jgi:hypothetical protein
MADEDITLISCNINVSNPKKPLDFKILLDGNEIYSIKTTESNYTFEHNLSDNEASHLLEFQLSGKDNCHTVVDKDGNVIESAQISITDISFEEINLSPIIHTFTTYEHDYNGHGAKIEDEYSEIMGWNGTVKIPFTTPIYFWLLEHM